jgi:amino acid adenylation domain-containing protein
MTRGRGEKFAARANDSTNEVPSVCVHHLFESQAVHSPDAIALVDGDRELTYSELNRRANEVASQLLALGVKEENLVAICLEPSIELFVGLLGILKAGGAYLPLDTSYPMERIDFMLRDSKVKIVLTDSSTAKRLQPKVPSLQSRSLVYLNACGGSGRADGGMDESLAANDIVGANPDTAVTPSNLAYCIYTSGSTGKPKGVLMEHRSLVNLLWWHDQTRPRDEGGKTLQFCAVGFDFSFHEIFSAICLGSTLVVVPASVRKDSFALAEFIARNRITKLFLPVPALTQLAAAVATGEAISLFVKEVITTGEQLRITPALIRFFRLTGAVLHNHYGATEFQDAAVYSLRGDPEDWPTLVPLGYPLSHVQVHVLDEERRAVPVGQEGELYIGGAGVARSYLRRPGLDRERFFSSPIDTGRLYRTGDLGRVRPDGALEGLGRADQQVKIRGYRVEVAEIEAVLGEHDLLTDCAVAAYECAGQNQLAAFVVLEPGRKVPDIQTAVTDYLRGKLPEYMLPTRCVALPALPLTASGKLDRRALIVPQGSRPELSTPFIPPRSKTERLLCNVWCSALDLDRVGIDDSFFDVGGTSLLLSQVQILLRSELKINLTSVELFQYSTIRLLGEYLDTRSRQDKADTRCSGAGDSTTAKKDGPRSDGMNISRSSDVAIIGMAGRFPGADSIETFWSNLCDGVESIELFTPDELEQTSSQLAKHPDYVKAGAVLDGIEMFDARFFGYSLKEAAGTDPQQRILLECAWEAFERAGYNPETYPGNVGVFAGSSLSTYLINNVGPDLGVNQEQPFIETDMAQFQAKIGNDRSYLSTRISYKLNLRGPSVNVQSACSTSLVAVHLGCLSLLSGESDMALAGGISVVVPHRGGYLFEESMVRSPDGCCRAFDARANGTIFGNGGGLVLLKRLDQALIDRDPIVAIIKGTAINNDGGDKAGFTAPSVDRQADVIAKALKVGNVDPRTIRFVEAHGTATSLGDPIEVAGLSQAFSQSGESGELRRSSCALGSVKTNIGHLDEGAGIAGLMKAALAVNTGLIPPSLHFSTPNPRIDFERSPFYVNTELKNWANDEWPRRAGVSSFGVGGTNSHAVLEAPPETMGVLSNDGPDRSHHLFTLSAPNREGLRGLVRRYLAYLEQHPRVDLGDLCFTANVGRKKFEDRLALVVDSTARLSTRLREIQTAEGIGQRTSGDGRSRDKLDKVTFLFTGQGSQYPDMGRSLFETDAGFRATVKECDERLRSHLGRSILEVMYGSERAKSEIHETIFAQPALFVLQYAMCKRWQSWGIEPDLLLGHSVGEIVAACVAGVFSLSDALKLVAARGRLMQALPRDGDMVWVGADIGEMSDRFDWDVDQVAVAAINGPRNFVLSGRVEALAGIRSQLGAAGIESKSLSVSHAFHSPLMDPMLEEFAQIAGELSFSQPRIGVVSNVEGKLMGPEQSDEGRSIDTANYWVQHVREPVRFAEGMQILRGQGAGVFIEMGPKPVLLGMGRDCLPDERQLWLPSFHPPKADWRVVEESLSTLFLSGASIDWESFESGHSRRRLCLPTYPWQKERCWIEAPTSERTLQSNSFSNVFEKSASEKLGPFLDEKLHFPASRESRYQTRLDVSHTDWLSGNRVLRVNVLSPLVSLEMVCSAFRQHSFSGAIRISNLEFVESPQRWTDPMMLQVVLHPTAVGQFDFDCIHRRQGAEGAIDWLNLSKGSIQQANDVVRGSIDVPAIRSRCARSVATESFYQSGVAQQHEYGAQLRGLEEIVGNQDEVLGRVKCRLSDDTNMKGYVLPPVFFEGCMQTVLAGSKIRAEDESPDLMLPWRFRELVLHEHSFQSDGEYWCYARRIAPNDWNFQLVTGRGEVVAEAQGYGRKPISESELAQEEMPRWLYRIGWKEVVPTAPPVHSGDQGPKHWLVFGDGDLGATLVEQLRAQGDQATLVLAGESFERLGESRFSIDPENAGHALRLVSETRFQGGLDGVLYGWAAGTGTQSQDLDSGTRRLTVGALHLVQALNHANRVVPVFFVTHGSQLVLGDETVHPSHTALWGMARTLFWEQRELGAISLDLDPGETDRRALVSQILSAVSGSYRETQLAWRNGVAYGARLSSASCKPCDSPDWKRSLDDESCYLLTGGVGGLGLKVAEYLVASGVRKVVLAARNAPSENGWRAVRGLEARGASVAVVEADVGTKEGAERLLDACRKTGTLRGVFHLAGVTEDATVANQSAQRFERVMSPKVNGAWFLHQMTQSMPLDLFVCFSSDSSLLGYASQTHYSAANGFLDGLACHRQALGLPSLTINWGPWADVGISSRVAEKYRTRMMRQGRYFLPSNLAIQALDLLLAQPSAQVAVLPIDWEVWAESQDYGETYSFVDELVDYSSKGTLAESGSVPKPNSFLARIRNAPVAARRDLLLECLGEAIGQVLGDSALHLGGDQGFFDYGLDSLTSIELRNLLQREFDVELPQTLAFTYPTLFSLGQFLIDDILSIEFTPVSQDSIPENESEGAEIDELEQSLSALSEPEAEFELLLELERLDQDGQSTDQP